jgi:hypothetical protein
MEIISADLLEVSPLQPSLPPCPFHSRDSHREKLEKINIQILRAKRTHNRIKLLYYLYWIGYVMELPTLTKSQRNDLKDQISTYNYVVATRIYRIFEFDPTQIFRTKCATTTHFYRLKTNQFQDLCLTTEFFAGAQN